MLLIKTNTNNAIGGKTIPNSGQRNDCKAVIAQITFADLGRGDGTLHTVGVARFDMQGRTAAGDANIQVQMGGGTVAAAMIFNSVQQTTDPANQRGAANGSISVLNQSMDSGTVWNLTGTLP
ncbi:hypothetical protein HFN83_32195 [Rhizobium laguerreae]|nr:hypothetical protein [Rhizobium laguerreae]